MADERSEQMGPKKRPTDALGSSTVRLVGESIGIQGVSEGALQYLADDVSCRLKFLVQEAQKFSMHAKTLKLSTAAFDEALKLKNIEPQYGFKSKSGVPIKFASGGQRSVFFNEETDIDLNELSHVTPSSGGKIPIDVSLKAHWLAIDGVQPAVPENVPPLAKKGKIADSEDRKSTGREVKRLGPTGKTRTLRTSASGQGASAQDTSAEQQLYFKEVTEACVGSDETKRTEAMASIALDPGIQPLLPRLCTFIAEGVRVNVGLHNLAILIYLMRVVNSLLKNSTLYLEKYLHELVPSVCTCVVSRQLCMKPDTDNHWALRDFAAKQLVQICRSFPGGSRHVQQRVTQAMVDVLQDERASMASAYGAVSVLGELGQDSARTHVLPHVSNLASRIQTVESLPNSSSADRVAARHIKDALLKYISPVLKALHSGSDLDDLKESFVSDYGPLGEALVSEVSKLRQSARQRVPTQSTSAQQPLSAQQARVTTIQYPTSTPGVSSTALRYTYHGRP